MQSRLFCLACISLTKCDDGIENLAYYGYCTLFVFLAGNWKFLPETDWKYFIFAISFRLKIPVSSEENLER